MDFLSRKPLEPLLGHNDPGVQAVNKTGGKIKRLIATVKFTKLN